MLVKIRSVECTLCCSCVDLCDFNALRLGEGKILFNEGNCTKCGICVEVCPFELITLE